LRDLTDLKTYIIDSDDPHEVDDAISLEIKEGNKKNLWIHISNPCKLFLHDSNVDLDARKRNSSLYLIDQYVPMLPKDILEKANLAQNKVSETISAAIEFNDDGSINKYEITEAIIKPKYQLTYEDANEILEIEPKEEIELIEIKNLLEKSITFRKKQGAIIFESPNSRIKLYKDKVALNKIEKSISQIIVAESMILMGYVTSLFINKYNLAAAFRIQKINCNPDGNFNHNPEPLPENITDLCSEVKSGKYQLGIVVDPDADRLVLVDERGEPFGEEYTLVAAAEYLLSKNHGASTCSNLSSTLALKNITEKYGGK